jgi:hypothetical protein
MPEDDTDDLPVRRGVLEDSRDAGGVFKDYLIADGIGSMGNRPLTHRRAPVRSADYSWS